MTSTIRPHEDTLERWSVEVECLHVTFQSPYFNLKDFLNTKQHFYSLFYFFLHQNVLQFIDKRSTNTKRTNVSRFLTPVIIHILTDNSTYKLIQNKYNIQSNSLLKSLKPSWMCYHKHSFVTCILN